MSTYPLRDYPNGAKWTGKYNGATQCKGFAYMIFDLTCGISDGSSISAKSFTTTSAAKKAFNSIDEGAMVNFTWAPGKTYSGNHSVIITDIDDDGISVYDCNFSAANTVGSRTWSWQDIINRFNKISGGLNP